MTSVLMGRRPMLAALAVGALIGISTAQAATRSEADGPVLLLCSDADGTPHPRRVQLTQLVTRDDLKAAGASRLLFGYSPDVGGPESRGRIKVAPRLIKPDGTSRRLGRVKTEQNRSNGEALVESRLDFALGRGDVVEWSLKLTRFEPLAAGRCMVFLAAAAAAPTDCGPYPESRDSDYVLPYRQGEAFFVSQGNCSAIGSHRGAARYAYDFAMPRGTEILAARAGVVVAVDDSRPDDTGLFDDDNAVVLEHADGTQGSYVHITRGGALVGLGEQVAQGQPIALSGNSGHTSGLPHLHFQVTPCPNRSVCGTLPVTFRNTRSQPDGLALGRSYRASGQ